MNILLEAPPHEAEAVDLCHADGGAAGDAYQIPLHRAGFVPLWQKARARTIGFRRNDLERTHWKKVCRSMQDD